MYDTTVSQRKLSYHFNILEVSIQKIICFSEANQVNIDILLRYNNS